MQKIDFDFAVIGGDARQVYLASKLSKQGIHAFFANRNFVYVHTPCAVNKSSRMFSQHPPWRTQWLTQKRFWPLSRSVRIGKI